MPVWKRSSKHSFITVLCYIWKREIIPILRDSNKSITVEDFLGSCLANSLTLLNIVLNEEQNWLMLTS